VLRTFTAPALFLIAGASGLPWGFCVHAALAAALGAWFLRSSRATTPPTAAHAPLTPLYDGAFFTVLALAGWALTGANRWIVAWRFGDYAAGLFTLAGNAALIAPSVLGTIFLQYFQPNFFALGDRATTDASARPQLARDVDRAALGYTAVAAFAVATLTAISPWLVGPLISETYRAALVWILPAGCFGVAAGTGLFYHSLLLSGRREAACGLVDLTHIATLIGGSLVASAISPSAFRLWLMFTPAVPWLVARPLARRYFFMTPATPAPAPAP
jgi:hypothetical protein